MDGEPPAARKQRERRRGSGANQQRKTKKEEGGVILRSARQQQRSRQKSEAARERRWTWTEEAGGTATRPRAAQCGSGRPQSAVAVAVFFSLPRRRLGGFLCLVFGFRFSVFAISIPRGLGPTQGLGPVVRVSCVETCTQFAFHRRVRSMVRSPL